VERSKSYVLDTSAIFCFKDDEEGASKIEKILEEAGKGECRACVSFMSLMEYLYVALIRYGDELARKAYLELTLLPLEIIESDEELRLAAAEFKANHNLSVADAWIAATAKVGMATLVHKDREFEAVSHSIKCLALPYKSS
jgi:ribonuclease VapC